MSNIKYVNDLLNFVENSNVDPDSELYFNAMEAIKYISGCELVDLNQSIAIVWGIDDVLSERPDLTEEQAGEVLSRVEDIHDCNHGISWYTIRDVAHDLYPEADEDE